jgi:carboxyl-terminal processing protease
MKKAIILIAIILKINLIQSQTKSIELTEQEKIFGLSKVWSEVKYNFVYFDKLSFDWDSLYTSNIESVKSAKTLPEYYNILRKMCAQLHDGHTGAYLPDDMYKTEATRPQFRTRLIENKVIITQIKNDTLKTLGLEKGMEITKINGMEAKEYAQKNIAPYVCASTPQDLKNRTYDYELFIGKLDEPITLELKDANGKSSEATVNRKLTNQSPKSSVITFTILENNVGLLTLTDFSSGGFSKKFDSIYPKILATNSLIIDVRNNGGGSSNQGYYVLMHLTNKPFYGSAWKTREYRPAYKAWGTDNSWYGESADKIEPAKKTIYDKPVIVLTSERTFSAAEDFCVAFDYMKRGKIVGTATGGSTGQPLNFDLPGGGSFRVCTKKDTYPDGKEFVGVGVQPNVIVEETIKGFRENKDLAINKALEIFKK